MNHHYRVVWNSALNLWQAVAECAASRGKGSGRSARRSKRAALAAAAVINLTFGAGAALAQSAVPVVNTVINAAVLPTGAQVVAGQARISQQGNVLTVQQGSARLATDWASFSIGAGQKVEFVQPSSSSVALNRVVGSDVSRIQGALTANGQVFLLNPNGVLFSPSAQVDVGGLVASTLKLSTADFMAGRYAFSGDSAASVINSGSITAAPGGTVALIAAKIVNTGRITADSGQVLLGAGSKVLLDIGGPVKLQVEQGAIDALIEQGGAVRADGGLVYLTAKAVGDLNRVVINHTGVTEARTLATGQSGEIYLLGDFAHGQVTVGGTLDASAPQGGHGGFVETSAAKVDFAPGRVITTHAVNGSDGTWLIDPNDFTIAASGGNITGSQLTSDLANGNVAISTATQGAAGGNGDIHVNDVVTWSANKLTLTAQRNIDVNATLTASGSGTLTFEYGQGTSDGAGSTYTAANGAKIYIPSGDAFTWKKGSAVATKNLVFDNGNLRFGNGTQASIDTNGQLLQPFYFDNTTAGRNGWFKLTYSSNPLNLALGAGGDGTASWNFNGQVLSSQDTLAAALGNKSIEISGFHEGTGTIVSASTVTFASGQTARLLNSYTLAPQSRYAQTDTQLTNLSNSALANVRLWVGTQDDWVGTVDGPTKTKGNINANGFETLSSAGTASNALKVTERTDGTGAAVLFYSTSAGVDMVHASCCSFTNVTNKNPRSSAITATTDGSYAMFMRLADLAPGQSGGFTWYYAAAPVSLLGSAITAVGQAAGGVTTVPVYLRLDTGSSATSSVYGAMPTFSYSLFDASTGGNVISNAAPTGTVTWVGAPTSLSNAGNYSITYGSGIVLGNAGYTLSAGAATSWTVTPRPLNIAVSKVYDGGTAVGPGFALSGMVNGNAAPTVSGAAALSSRNIGSYSGFASSTLALSDANYTLTGGTVVATVTQRPITVTADAKGKTYGDADPALSYQVSSGSLVGGDALSGTLTRAAGENVGGYTIDASTLANGNYAVTANNGTLTIGQRPITVTAEAKGKTYGNADPLLSYQVTSGNLLGSDTLGGALSRAAGENVGGYTIDASTLANSNYAVTANNGTLTISQRPITVTAEAKGKTYGNADPLLSYQVTSGNLLGSDTLGGALSRAAGENVGRYTIDASALANGNYAVTANNGTLTISQRPITVTAEAKGKTYGNADPTLNYRISSGELVGSDVLTGALTRAAGESVGSYTIAASALANGNYALTVQDGTLTISPSIDSNQLAGNRPIATTINASTAATWQIGAGSGGLVLADSAEQPSRASQPGGLPGGTAAAAGPMRVFVTAGGIRLPESTTAQRGTTETVATP